MNLLIKIVIISLIFLNISCKNNDNLVIKKEVSFKNSLGNNYRFFGKFEQNNKAYVYFADLMTRKKIYFHDNKGVLEDSILFNNPLLIEKNIHSLSVISKDTLLLYSNREIISINKKCEIIKTLNLDTLLVNENIIYEISALNSSSSPNLKNQILIRLSFREAKNQISTNEDYYKQSFDNPNLLIINNFFTQTVSYKLYPYNYYKYLFKDSGAFLENFKYFKLNGNYVLCSNFSDRILIFDSLFKNYKTIKIESNFTEIGKSKPLVSFANRYEFANIQEIFYLKKSKEYIFIIRHEIEKDNLKLKNARPFSMIKLDNEFNKLNEKAYLNDLFKSYRAFLLNEQIYINKNLKDEDKNVFSSF